MGQDADDVAQVALGVELVQAGGRDEAEDVPGGLGVAVAAGEQRGVSDPDDLAQLSLGQVVSIRSRPSSRKARSASACRTE